MKKFVLAATAAMAIAAAAPASAALVLNASAAKGVDLNNVRVGDTFRINFFMTGNQGERLTGRATGTAQYLPGAIVPVAGAFYSSYTDDASLSPAVFYYDWTAVAAGRAIIRGILTDAETTSGVQSFTAADLDFNVVPALAAVPEPATWGMMLVGFGMIGFGMRRRKADVRTSVRFA